MGNVFRALGVVASMAVAYWFSLDLMKKNADVSDQQIEDEYVPAKSTRKPASVKPQKSFKRPTPNQPTEDTSSALSLSENRMPDFQPTEESDAGGGTSGSEAAQTQYSSVAGGGSSSYSDSSSSSVARDYSRNPSPQTPSRSNSTSGSKTATTASTSTASLRGGTIGIAAPPYFPPTGTTSSTGGTTSGTTSGSTSGGSSGPGSASDTPVTDTPTSDPLTCSVSQGSGVYGNPVQVSISCSAASDIKYCIQSGSCCDPKTAGITYSSPLAIGSQDGSYCVSYYGVSTAGKSSTINSATYTINNTFPHLQVQTPKIFYQTTELPLASIMASSNFGNIGYGMGQINMKSHNPGLTGLNMGCQEIVEEYATIPAPVPVSTFSPLDLSTVASGLQLNVSTPLNKLEYGDNYLTTYVVDNNHAVPLYSCSTNKVTLQDFEFFNFELSYAEPSATDVSEFSGSVVVYGFFEEQMEVTREPAGSATENVSGQQMGLNSFGVFY